MVPAPVVVKLGGSVLTRKRESPAVRLKVLVRLAEELAEGWAKGQHPLVVLHGAGSFGHPTAKAWGLAKAPPGPRPGRPRGAALTSLEVRRLHTHVLRALLDAGLPALSVPPCPSALNREGKLVSWDLGPMKSVLSAGWVPVSFGDVVVDEAWGSSILSADTIALHLVRSGVSRRVVFVSDVDGVLETTKKGSPVIRPVVDKKAVEDLRPTPGVPDVTGGIRGKAEAMLSIAGAGGRAGLISGLSHGRLSRAVKGEDVYGSWAGNSQG